MRKDPVGGWAGLVASDAAEFAQEDVAVGRTAADPDFARSILGALGNRKSHYNRQAAKHDPDIHFRLER
jgi:hypothetical protein